MEGAGVAGEDPVAQGGQPVPGLTKALSPSRAADFLQCPMLYRFRVVDQLPEPPSAAAARGTLVHGVLERIFDLPAPQRTMAAAAALVPREWDRMVDREPALGELAGEVGQDGTLALLEQWFALEDPTRLEPAERELYVEADLDGLVLRGYVDRLDVSPDGRLRVVDYKTGRAPSETFEGRALFQLKFYGLALWRGAGVLPSRLQLVYPRDRTVLWIDPTEADLLATERKIKALWSTIEQVAEDSDWRPRRGRHCSWCAHQSICPAWGGTPPPLPADARARALDPRVAGRTDARTEDADHVHPDGSEVSTGPGGQPESSRRRR